ncbi:MAG: TlpA family protein disulfide reductase [Bacteroidaceae bacterium]|nr:TlpA family protein disulfide reductase [Bacteroidaceae bacterium]
MKLNREFSIQSLLKVKHLMLTKSADGTKSIITTLLALVALTGHGQVKCHVAGSIAEGTQAVGLVIYRDGTDPKDSPLKLTVKEGHFECDVEDTQIERWHIVDFGEVLEKGMTSRSGAFFSEDGATVTISLDGDKFKVTSTGKEYQQWQVMEEAAEAKFMPAYEALDEDDEAAMNEVENQYHQWMLDYYKAHPMLGFLLELNGRLKGFHFNDTGLASMLDIYHQQYTNLYANHPVHQSIAAEEAKDYQICGRKYNDYDVRTMDGQQVRASNYYQDRLTLVICWASWCAPCIREANDIIPLYNQYHYRGLNVFSLAHEFKSTDAMRKAVERNGYPWPCLVDLDDEFGVFKKHGTANSALFLIDRLGNILAVPNSVDELKGKLVEILGE